MQMVNALLDKSTKVQQKEEEVLLPQTSTPPVGWIVLCAYDIFPLAVNSRLFCFHYCCFTLFRGDLFKGKKNYNRTKCLLISLEKVKRLKNATEMRQQVIKHQTLTFV